MNPSLSATTQLPCAHPSRGRTLFLKGNDGKVDGGLFRGWFSRSVVFSASGQHFFVDSGSYHLAESPPLLSSELVWGECLGFCRGFLSCHEMGACIFTIGTFKTFLYLSVTNNIQLLRTIPFMGTST